MFEWIGNKFEVLWDNVKFITVTESQQGIIYRNGILRKVMKPGIHPRIPFMESYKIVNVKPETFRITPITVTTTDGKTVSVSGMYERHVHDVVKFVQEFNGSDGNLQDLARSVTAHYIIKTTWEDAKTSDTVKNIQFRIREEGERMGVTVTKFAFTDISLTRMYSVASVVPTTSTP